MREAAAKEVVQRVVVVRAQAEEELALEGAVTEVAVAVMDQGVEATALVVEATALEGAQRAEEMELDRWSG